jgi:hypothetical protein
MFWTLWNVRNKLTIEGKAIAHPANAFFQNVYIYAALEGAGQREGHGVAG